MKPEEITEENWTKALEAFLKSDGPTLCQDIRSSLDLPTQHMLRALRDKLPPKVTMNDEEVNNA